MGLRNRNLYHDKNTFFITTSCFKKLPIISIGNGFQILGTSLNFSCEKYNAKLLGFVIMPNHIHVILHFAEGKQRSPFMRDLKKFTSTKLRQEIEIHEPHLLSSIRYFGKSQVYKIWQDRFDEVYLDDKKLLETKLDYIHSNPLQERWNLVAKPEDYLYSSSQFYEKGKTTFPTTVHYRDYF